MSQDCDTCKRYLKSVEKGRLLYCYKAVYFYPGQIWYCRPQMRWAGSYYPLLADGVWPPDQRGTGYTDPAIRDKQVKIPKKYAEDLASEIDKRLESCGEDGDDLIHLLVKYGPDCLLTGRAVQVLNYISGWRRRKTPYRAWLRLRRSRNQAIK